MVNDIRMYKELTQKVQSLYEEALEKADPKEKSIRIGDRDVWVTRQEAKRMLHF